MLATKKPHMSILSQKQAKTIKELAAVANAAGLVPKLKIDLVSHMGDRSKENSLSVRDDLVMTPEVQSQRYTMDKTL